ncbi:tyrosine-protein phosphatase [Brevibacterium sp.]|uniref:tyrosine-protein phosphatase n=1 Tax=Brevibacterium sp. TaxID=1701 RepID=UPI002811B3D1|nr:tyrosine-protein phosphatase [Brevibacterium sp.]
MSLDRIDIEGTFNFRDIGGAPVAAPATVAAIAVAADSHPGTASADDWRLGSSGMSDADAAVTSARGYSVTTGTVFRADGLAQLTDKARADLVRLGISTVIDLRDIGERANLPDALDGLDVEYIELPVFGDLFFPVKRQSREEMKAAAEATGMDLSERSLEKIYELMISHFGSRLALAVDAIAEHAEAGVVFHCSAGKDRTGVVAAFIHELLGVGRDDILAEYSATQQHLSGAFLEAIMRNFADAGISGDLATTATAAPPELLATTLDRILDDYGNRGIEGYLLDHGMDPQTPTLLRQALVVPTD